MQKPKLHLKSQKFLNYLTVFVFFSLLTFTVYLLPKVVLAANPIPKPKVPCDVTHSPEFNSDRPYQASPCGDSIKALFCGNNLTIYEDTPAQRTNGKVDFKNVDISMPQKTYVISVKDIQLPILGNTEKVQNSQNPTDSIDDATKMNEYVSWYLNGVTDHAEYGNTKNTDANTVNFSGPLNKLLPSIILDAERTDAVKNAVTKTTFLDEETNKPNTDFENHDETVVCASRELLGLIGKYVAHPCYAGNGSDPKEKVYKLSDFNRHLPPLPWDKAFNGDPDKYVQARCEWTGGAYLKLPIINKSVCIDNPFNSNEWSDLFPFVPLANTTDKNSKQPTSMVVQAANGTEIIPPVKPTDSELADLSLFRNPIFYFAHTLEDAQLSNELKSTYAPKTGTTSNPGTRVASPDDPLTGKCQIVDVRSNDGDNVFADANPNSEIRVTVNRFTVTKIPCHYSDALSKLAGTPISECRGEVAIGIGTQMKMPYADQIFNTTTAGSNSIFRRIFPKVEEGAPVSCIADNPAVSGVTYTAGQNVKNLQVKNPSDENTTGNSQVYFPHVGSVLDYFLKGIQTALRPQGFGEPIQSGVCQNALACGDLSKLPKASASCGVGSVSGRLGTVPQSLKSVIGAAASTYNVPPNLILAVLYGEGVFNQPPFKRYDWTENNAKSWATCQNLPKCTGPSTSIVDLSFAWNSLSPGVSKDLKKIDPARKTANPCNLMDAIFVLAKDLHNDAGGSSALTGKSCFGQVMSSTSPSSCTWDPSQYETAIRVWEDGVEWGNTSNGLLTCATKAGSCGTGGGLAAQCPTDTLGRTDTCVNTSASNSHNACLWDVAHGQ